MNKNKQSLFILIIAIGIFYPFLSNSQQIENLNHTPAAIEKFKLNQIWNKTDNAAGLSLDNTDYYSLFEASYNLEKGDFKRPQKGLKENELNFGTEGGVKIKNWYVWGNFSYKRNVIKDANYNASIIDPYRGMPYYIADSNLSNWNNQHYDLSFKINFPKINNKIALGLGGDYLASLGAKQRDPRTENYFMKIRLTPSIVFSPNMKNHFGANLEYYNLKEESRMENINTNISQTYYRLYGLGNSIIGLGSGRSTNYTGDNFGGGVQYNFTGKVNLLLSSNYSLKFEDARVSFSTPQDEGSTEQRVWVNKLLLHIPGQGQSHYIYGRYTKRDINGIQYITQRDNSESQSGWITLFKSIRSTYSEKLYQFGYDWTKDKANEYSWLLGTQLELYNKNDIYLIPASYKDLKNVFINIHSKKNVFVSEHLRKRLLIDISAGINKNIGGEYVYNGQHADYPIVTQLEQGDFNFLTTNFKTLGISATYSQQVKNSSLANIFFKVEANYSKANENFLKYRNLFGLSLGCNF